MRGGGSSMAEEWTVPRQIVGNAIELDRFVGELLELAQMRGPCGGVACGLGVAHPPSGIGAVRPAVLAFPFRCWGDVGRDQGALGSHSVNPLL
jgi:hypothetical protein